MKSGSLFLVTGGCGFIGSHLVDRLLALGHRVRVLDDLSSGRRENLAEGAELQLGSITDPEAVAASLAGIDGCFHLAAIASVVRSNEEWLATHAVNLGGTLQLLDAIRETGRPLPFVYASSAAVYGDPASVPIAEAAPTIPLTAYGADKLGSELHARVGGRIHGLPTFGLRFFNVYGPRQDPSSPYSGVISIFVRQALAARPITILGDGEQLRDFVHVADVVEHLIAALEAAALDGPVANVCTGVGTTVAELAELVMQAAGRRVPLQRGAAREGDIRRSLGSPDLARAKLRVAAKLPLLEGLRDLVGQQGRQALSA